MQRGRVQQCAVEECRACGDRSGSAFKKVSASRDKIPASRLHSQTSELKVCPSCIRAARAIIRHWSGGIVPKHRSVFHRGCPWLDVVEDSANCGCKRL